MHCPNCGSLKSSVLDSRYKSQIKQKRRRRQCKKCGQTFTTLEQVSDNLGLPPRVIKRDGRREAFDQGKLKKGLLLAVAKRPVATESVDLLIAKVVKRLIRGGKKEVKSDHVGGIVMQELAQLDRVAYIRFASVYRNFNDAGAFKDEADNMEKILHSDLLDMQQRFTFADIEQSDSDHDDEA